MGAGRRCGVPGHSAVRQRRRRRSARQRRSSIPTTDQKEDDYADQANFVPFITETGGRIGDAGLRLFDTLTGVAAVPVAAPGRLSAAELARRHKSAALLGAVRALIRHQGFMPRGSCWRRSWRRSTHLIWRLRAVVGAVVWLLCLAVFLLLPAKA